MGVTIFSGILHVEDVTNGKDDFEKKKELPKKFSHRKSLQIFEEQQREARVSVGFICLITMIQFCAPTKPNSTLYKYSSEG